MILVLAYTGHMTAPQTDTAAIRQIIRALSAQGFIVRNVWNGEEEIPVKGEREAIAEITSVDEASAYFSRDGEDEHGVFFVLGNEPDEVASDWHTGNEEFSKIISTVTESWW